MGDLKLSQITTKVTDWGLSNLKLYVVDENGTPVSEYGLTDELITYLNSLYVVLSDTDQDVDGEKTFLKDVTLGTNLELSHTDASTIGVITKDSARFIHDFSHPTGGGAIPNGNNLFIGLTSGNFTTGSTATGAFMASNNVGVGLNTLSSLTNGYDNMALGTNSSRFITTGASNMGVGESSQYNLVNGFWNTGVGTRSGYTNISGSRNINIGFASGYYETGSDKVYISSLPWADQVDEATAKTKAIIYGEQSATTSSQILRINANLQLFGSGTYFSVDGSNNMTFTDAVTGTKTLAELSAASGGKTISKNNTYTVSLDVDKDEVYCDLFTQTEALAINNTFSNGDDSYLYGIILTSGDDITFPVGWTEIKNEYESVRDSAYYGYIAFYDGLFTQYQLYYIEATSILFQDNFEGVTINTAKWDIDDLGSLLSQNDELIIDRNITDNFTLFNKTLQGGSGVLALRFDLRADNTEANPTEQSYVGLYSDDEATDLIRIAYTHSTTVTNGNVRLNSLGSAATATNQNDISLPEDISLGVSLKIVVDLDNDTQDFYCWSGGAWVQIGVQTTQVVANTLKVGLFSIQIARTGSAEVDNFYLTNEDFATLTP